MDLADEYLEVFGEPIPIYQIPAEWDDERVKLELRKAIDSGEPLKVEEKEGIIY